MTALPKDVVADLRRRVAELEQRLESGLAERDEAIAQQAASAEVLQIINSSPGNLTPVFEEIAKKAMRFSDAAFGGLWLIEGDKAHLAANINAPQPFYDFLRRQRFAVTEIFGNRSDRDFLHIVDVSATKAYRDRLPATVAIVELAAARTLLLVPLFSKGAIVGIIGVHRQEVRPFSDRQIALVQSFAAQAVIAMENARLLSELGIAGDRQAASAEILRAIASTPGDAERPLQQIAETTTRLFGASSVTLNIASGDEWARMIRVGPSSQRVGSEVSAAELRIGGRNLPGTVFRENRQIHIPDLDNLDPAFADWPTLPHARAAGARAMAGTPLRREGKAVGALVVHRDRPVPFSDEELALLQSFADQAVIAIENARLFNETQEALARQTASAEILRVISQSPTDVRPVFDAIVLTAVRLIGCDLGFVLRCDGTTYSPAAAATPEGPMADLGPANLPIDPGINFPSRAIVDKKMLHLPDWSVIDLPEHERNIRNMFGVNSALYLPLLRGEECIGLLALAGNRAGIFGESEIALAESFRDQALIAIENTRLFNETKEALERQTATADILKAIARSPSDVQPVFEAIASSANRLIGGYSTAVLRFVDGLSHLAAFTPTSPAADEALKASFPRRLADFPPFEWVRNGETGQIADAETFPDEVRDIARARGYRSVLFAPLMSNGAPIGLISVTRVEPGSFAAHHVQLLQTFADQAVIAIENTRLFNETREALERQTATADILKVIAGSPSDVQPVFEAIATSAKRLIGGFSTAVFRFVDGVSHLAAFTPTNPAADEILKASFPRPLADFEPLELVQTGEVVQITETETSSRTRDIARARGFRNMLFSPLMSKGTPIGMISVTRVEPGSFADHHVQLLQTFAAQAVIAIENVRLFNETQAKTRELSEALTYQTGSSNILSVIASSPTDVGPVLEAIVKSACELCEAYDATVALKDGDDLWFSAHHGPIPIGLDKWPISRHWTAGRAFLDQKPVHVRDLQSDEDFPEGRELARRMGHHSILSVPLLREGESIGAIALRRTEVQPFSDKQIALLQTFADQAVIAIGNVRLFEEVQAKTRDLTESLQQQTATADVLKVISRSAFDLDSVLNTLIQSGAKLCEAPHGVIWLRRGDKLHLAAHVGYDSDWVETARNNPVTPDPEGNTVSGRVAATGKYILIEDITADERFMTNQLHRMGQYRAALMIPLIRDGKVEGTIGFTRLTKGRFSQRQIELVETFADQAVIAIENARLFDEVQAKTHELSEALTYQTGSSNILSVIASSPTDVGPVLKAIVESASELCEADDALVVLKDGDDLVFKAQHGSIPVVWQRQPVSRNWTAGRAVVDRKPVHVHDLLAPEGEEFPEAREFARRTNVRTVLSVPLLRENESIGSIVLRRTDVRPFSDKQVALLHTFADQAVIAIGNVRLFEEVQAKTRDLTEALTYQTGSGNILRVIASSPTDVGPVLNAIVESASELCEAYDAVVLLKDGDDLRFSAHHGPIPINIEKWPISRGWTAGRAFLDQRPVHVRDLLSDQGADFPDGRELSRIAGLPDSVRTILSVPLLREKESIGAILLRRTEVEPFSEKQIALLQTFADQAVIAIGNVRLFDEVQQRTRELSQSLDDLRTAQDRLVQTEKLASLGQLTAGIAHEIKNPLNFVNNFSALSAELTDELNDALKPAALNKKIRGEVDELTRMLKANLEKVVLHGKRADSIVKNMLLHSREGSGERRPTDINALLDEGLNLAYHGARAEKPQFNVTLQRDFDEKAGTVELFPQEITRAFLNLISNGFYAATKRKAEIGNSGFEPTLRATTRNLGETVEIRIRDNGTGIPTEVKEKMFNPFFTTKPAGEGTGLGLSMSHDIIVKQHGGTIDVETEPGQFTEFTIVLPRTSNIPNKTRGQT